MYVALIDRGSRHVIKTFIKQLRAVNYSSGQLILKTMSGM